MTHNSNLLLTTHMELNNMAIHEIKTKAFLFDMDGTLVDSRPVVENVLRKFSEKHNLELQKVIDYAHGRQSIDTATHFLGNNDFAMQEAKFLEREELLPQSLKLVKAMTGAKELLDLIDPNDWVLVTSASREIALERMKAAQLPIPKITVCAEDVRNGKPSPDGYLLAATKIDIPIQQCVVFEDAEAGIQAGINSGAQVLAVNGFVNNVPNSVYQVNSLDKITITHEQDFYRLSFTI